MSDPRDYLIVALDVATLQEARELTRELNDTVKIYKIGLELLFAGGTDLAQELMCEGKQIFLDAKLLDIGNTVEKATANIARLGATFLTVHATDRKTMDAARRGKGDSQLKLLAVTVMTNLDQSDLSEQGIEMTPEALVLHRTKLAIASGFDGVIASGHEAKLIRDTVGDDLLIITPGIRPAGSNASDQTRVMTPAKAIAAGASGIVVGRPVVAVQNPLAAAKAILEEIRVSL